MTTQTVTPEALAFYKAAQRVFCNLYERWLDESKYEDIRDYAIPLQSIAQQTGVTISKMGKKPFSCFFSVGEKSFVLKISRNQYLYSRIG